MSDAELILFSEQNRPLRVERKPNGDLSIMTPTSIKTSIINGRVYLQLAHWAETDGTGLVIETSGGFPLPDGGVRAADAAWVSRRKWEALTNEQHEKFALICPEFVIEIQSPSVRGTDQRAKLEQTRYRTAWNLAGCWTRRAEP